MVFGLLALAALPTTIGVAESISATKKKDSEEEDPTVASTTEAQRMRKFHLRCYCDAPSRRAREVDGGDVVLRDGKLYIHHPSSPLPPSTAKFLGFYIPYPDPTRHPPPLGLVSFIPTTPPTLNWIYITHPTRSLNYGNRTASISHTVGPWGWDTGSPSPSPSPPCSASSEEDGGGLTLNGHEGGVVVETEDGWQLFWEGEDDESGVGGEGEGGRRFRVSLERDFVEEVGGEDGEGKGEGKDRGKEKGDEGDKGKGKVEVEVEVRGEKGEKKEDRRTETVMEVRGKKDGDEDRKSGGEKEERTRVEYRR